MKSKENLLNSFFSSSENPKYIYGINASAIEVFKKLKEKGIVFEGFIDKNTKETFFKKHPVLHSFESIEQDAIILSCDYGLEPVTTMREIRAKGIGFISIYEYYSFFNKTVPFYCWHNDFSAHYLENKEKYNNLTTILADSISKQTLIKLVNFRINMDLSYMEDFVNNEEGMYFEPFLNLKEEGESFMDIGSYDGFSSMQFIKYCPDYSQIWCFEPANDLMTNVKQRLSKYDRITYMPYAASDKDETLYFELDGEQSMVTESGSVEVQARKLDDIIDSKVTYIKMDIEGSESKAIDGLRETIKKHHPRLAVSVYHRTGDIVDIFDQVMAIRNDYTIYLRHYKESFYDTVMFFIPQ